MFKYLDTHTYLMPGHFGGVEGAGLSVYYNNVTQLSVIYETDPEALGRYVNEEYEIRQPCVIIGFVYCHEVDYLAGGWYNIAQAMVPVRYTRSEDPIEGYFPLVVWENRTEPILGGREQSGVPKIFCDIAECQVVGDHLFATASHSGHDFLRIDVNRKAAFTQAEIAGRNQHNKFNLLGWRYIPNVGKPGAAVSHATLYPQESTLLDGWNADGKVTWTRVTWEQVPMQAHIINALADLSVRRYVAASVEKCKLILHPRLCRALP